MPGLEVRAAVSDDAPALREIFRQAALSNEGDRANLLAHPETLEWSDVSIGEGRTRVATARGEPVGFATYVPADGTFELEDLFVDPRWMRRGVATRLIEDVASIGRSRGIHAITVVANPHALDFYRSVGFVSAGSAETRFGPAPRMRLDLRP